MKNTIKKIIENNDLNLIDNISDEDIVRLVYELESNGHISFVAEQNYDEGIRFEYYSERIGKTIIWNYDALTGFGSIEELTEYIEGRERDIQVFESQLPDLSPVAML